MKTLLLTVVLGLVAALRAQDPLGLVSEQLDVTGTWYVKAVVDSKGRPAAQSRRKVTPVMVTETVTESLFVNFTYMELGQCQEMGILLEKVRETGKYRLMDYRWLRVVEELPMKDHYIFYCEGYCAWRTFRVGRLVGRNLEVNLEAMEEFKKFAQRRGFLLKNIFIPVQTENCIPEGD